MDAQELRNLQEAYLDVYQVDEAITSEKGKAKAAAMIAARSTPSGRAKSGQGASVAAIKHIGRANVENLGGTPPTPTIAKNPVKSRSYGGTGNKAARRAAALNKEQVDIYDIILSHLLDEGYAETPEAAEVIMVNMSEEWRDSIVEEFDELDEGAAGDVAARASKLARQKKGQTPERQAMYKSLAQKATEREEGPYKVGDTRKGLTSAERTTRRDDDAYHSDVHGSRPGRHQHGEPSYGKGGITKNPRKLAQQKARGQHG